MLNKNELRTFIKHATSNREVLKKDNVCGCYYCKTIFAPSEITNWVKDSNGDTALCPYCMIDSVFSESAGYEITPKLLKELNKYWFG